MSMQETPWYTRARHLGRQGRASEAVAELRAGLAAGAWYNPEALVTDPDLRAVHSELAPILHDCEARRRQRRAETRPLCLVLSPSGGLWDQQTLLLLHGRGGTAREVTNLWRPLVDEGWTLVVPQSTQPWDSASWCWDDADVARREIRVHLEECQTKRGLDPGRIVVAGASQGGQLAAQIAAEAGMPWLCVDPDSSHGYEVAGSVPATARGTFLRSGPDFTARVSAALRLLERG
jgi:hypothetical protein